MANNFKVTVGFPPLDAEDVGEVLTRKFLRSVNGAAPIEEVLPVSQAQVEFAALQSDALHLELFNIDDAGNLSTSPSVRDVVVSDTTPPHIPGEMNVTYAEVPDVPAA
jgi:hypothetical protein